MSRFYLGSGCSWIPISALLLLGPPGLISLVRAEDESKKDAPLVAGSKAGDEWPNDGLKMKFCWCPPGTFTMGSPKDEKDRSGKEDQVSVAIRRGFWLGKYELTQGEWGRIMGTTLRGQRDKADPKFELKGEGASYPMYFVSQDEATEYCVKLTEKERKAGRLPADWEYRLPTETQWEYACRAGTKTATAFGDKLGSDQANFDGTRPYNGADKGDDLMRTATVASYKGNAWGLHDMHGNASEWCRNWYDKSLPAGVDSEVTERPIRMYRGGSWSDAGRACRSASRNWSSRGLRSSDVGFRVAVVQLR